MGQRELWDVGEEAFVAKRSVLVPVGAPLRVQRPKAPFVRQTMMWSKYRASSFRALRSALVSFEQTRAYGQFCRFLRDELWVDCRVWSRGYRLDYIQFLHGEPQYRLSHHQLLLGKLYIRPGELAAAQHALASYLMSAYGFTVGEVYQTTIRLNAYKLKSLSLLAKAAS